ncbi:MAG TPA: aconitate hydratase AcnA [Spirochaetia bacterium]|nr:aconitate hydratase AcnA [Spirochaetia bacterium]
MTNKEIAALKKSFTTAAGPLTYFSLAEAEKRGMTAVSRMPYTLKIILEAILRQLDGDLITDSHLEAVLKWDRPAADEAVGEIPFKPARIIMQDFTGVPAIVDLAAMRDSLGALKGDPKLINPLIPVDLIIDHSVQVDRYGSTGALAFNAAREFERNRERYEFLKWASKVFSNFTVVPPATGICHQVNLEYLARVVQTSTDGGETMAYPDTLLGTDSHTTMINGLGVLGWGVGGIEAEAAMLGQPLYMQLPEVIGMKMAGHLNQGVTATDLVLAVTNVLRKEGVVGKFVEFFGDGLTDLSLPDRATISNMCPEYGATAALFPVDESSLRYLELTGRAQLVELVEKYTKAQGLFRDSSMEKIQYAKAVTLDLGSVKPSIAGPKRPQDKIELRDVPGSFSKYLTESRAAKKNGDSKGSTPVHLHIEGDEVELSNGDVAIAAITSCTNTSNPSVMIGAALIAKRAVELGLKVKPYVKTSMAPGSRVVTRYLELAGLMPYLEALGFHVVGYGCTTCIGNSGPLKKEISEAILDNNMLVAGVLSGNRNFEGRIHPEVRANYLASPPLVVAYALAGSMDIDLTSDPIGNGPNGEPVYLKDLWPTTEEINQIIRTSVTPKMYGEEYSNVYTGNETWNDIKLSGGQIYDWKADSTYIRRPPFFEGLTTTVPSVKKIEKARVLAYLGESVTTDHISPAGMIPLDSPAADWLREHEVTVEEFNTYGSRRGNHEVMMRGTFGNIRIRNRLVPGTEGGLTRHLPDGEQMSIYDAAMRYQKDSVPLVVLAGKDYGMGSSRDWAAKGTILLGVTAVIAESYERIHRSNLIGMGVLPLQFAAGESASSLGLTGEEEFDIEPVGAAGQELTITARSSGGTKSFKVRARIDTSVELVYYKNGGILHTLIRKMAP